MGKLSSEFKDEVNKEFSEFDYVGKKVGFRVFIVAVAICLASTIGNVFYKEWKTGRDREIFKNSATYTETAAAFLADSYQEYNEAETKEEKNAVMQYVIMRYPNLDLASIENATLRQFYNQCLIGG